MISLELIVGGNFDNQSNKVPHKNIKKDILCVMEWNKIFLQISQSIAMSYKSDNTYL